ncbi:MAG TPA: Fur family transcriptional regulator [Arachnia sp.]|nr:Fur family transcriptional regulator [Arachnia sp.]HMT85529.1 Fur family transcriptional regulator [Arachnia sp.]
MPAHPLPSTEDSAALLRSRGLRVTAGRVAALSYLSTQPHSSAAEIHAALTGDLSSLSSQSVHNIVQDLSDCGILRRVDLPDSGSARYEVERLDNHHHIQCVVCRRIEDVECAIGLAPCLTPSDAHGMRVIEAALTFRGICRDCDDARDPTTELTEDSY